jgi:hypothetical protein
MDKRILELALEALQVQKAKIDSEIELVRKELRLGTKTSQPPAAPKRARGRRQRTKAERQAQSARMKAYWAGRKKGQGKTAGAAPAAKKTRTVSAAARKAASERMKAYWAKKRKEG